jgi:glycosyltransferase involved in cell wall biosynthesis
MPVKICYIISDIEKALSFEWIYGAINKKRIELQFIILARNPNSEFISFLKEKNVTHHVVMFAGKKDLIKGWFNVYRILRKEKPHAVHTHLFFANLVGLSAAWFLRIPKRIHTRHHASIHHVYFPRTVIIDKLINALSTDIITLSQNHFSIVSDWERTKANKVHLIPHGFDLDYFGKTDPATIGILRHRHQIPEGAYPVIGVIARYTEWKGIQFIIPAFLKVIRLFPKAHLVLANAHGDFASAIRALLNSLPAGSYTEIAFESEVAALYRLFDVFIHTPVDKYCESFGQTYVEALASGIPSIFTLSGIASDFIVHEKNALVVGYRSIDGIASAVERIVKDPAVRESLISNGQRDVIDLFSLDPMIIKLEQLYLST